MDYSVEVTESAHSSAMGNTTSVVEETATQSSSSSSSAVEAPPPADGEIAFLMEEDNKSQGSGSSGERDWQDLEVDGAAVRNIHPSSVDDAGDSVYGEPLSLEEADKRMPPGGNGLICHATVIPDEFFANVKQLKALNRRDLNSDKTALKPRRPSLPVRASNFFSSLTRVGPRYIFHGVLNGWPGLTCFEVMGLEQKGNLPGRWIKIWRAKEEGAKGIALELPDRRYLYRATLQGPPWTVQGWSEKSPGFVFWYEPQRPKGPLMTHGTDLLTTVEDAQCTYIHMVSHRYAVKRESPRDRITYHSICLLEWDHGRYMTVAETAYLNGMGGYNGRCNWYDDKNEPITELYQMLPPEMIRPWRTDLAEIRCYDVAAKTVEEFRAYLKKYEGNEERFVDPRIHFSHVARLTFRTKRHIAQYLLNYIMRDATYVDLRRNCQTFAADFCSFIAGKKDITPFHPVIRIDYQPRTYLFLYDSHLYNSNKKPDKKK